MELLKVSIVLWIVLLFKQVFSKETESFPPPEFEAVAGGEAHLPCNYTLPEDPELVSLMLWYRDQERVPIYTVDFRKGTRDNPKHFTIPEYADRAYFDVTKPLPTIRLDGVGVEDEGSYRCNVEFKRSRTVTRMVKLKILVPPHSVLIMDDRGQRLKGVVGPYDEGAYLTLLCEAEGGNPSPSVIWWRDRSLYDDSFYRASHSYVRNELSIEELRRTDLMVEYSCLASNTNLTQPVAERIKIDLNLKPLYVRITTPHKSLTVGDDVRLHCETSGSRPPAKISWWLDNTRIQSGKEAIPNNRNITYSSLTIASTIDNNGKTVYCKAENTALAHAPLQDSWVLNILFPPDVTLHLGANIKYSTIKEGNDVYMECSIRANPPISELTWLFENKPFYSNASAGVIISNQSLVLQKVKKEHRGRYRCIATNSEGEGESSDLYLEVRYTPFCKPSQRDIYGVARDEVVNISCEVDSDPPDVTFRWTLNNSLEHTELQNYESISGTASVITYSPKTVTDYGALQCWGRNAVGEQKEPCVVRIIPAGPPDPVRNCLVVNQSHSWLQVECEPGYSNGLKQKFHLDVYNSAVDHLQINMTSLTTPKFSVHDLPSGTPFVLVVYASNEKGRSNTLAIVGHTSPSPLESSESALSKLSPLVGILLAVLGTLLMIGVVGLAFVQIRRRRPSKTSIEEDKSKTDAILKKLSDEFTENAPACPDVVPPNNTVYLSPDGESICEISKDPDKLKSKDNYRNCVVALKRSWSFKKGHQVKTEVEVALTDLNNVMTKQQLDPSSTTLLGDVTLEDSLTSKKIVVKVEPSPESLQGDRMYRTDSV